MKIETQMIIELQDINDHLKTIAKVLTELNERNKTQLGVKR